MTYQMRILFFRKKIGGFIRQLFVVIALMPYILAALYFFATSTFFYLLSLCFQYAKEIMLAIMTAMSIAFRVELQIQKKHLIKKSREIDILKREIKRDFEKGQQEILLKNEHQNSKIRSVQRDVNALDKLVRDTREQHIGIREQVATLLNLFKGFKDL